MSIEIFEADDSTKEDSSFLVNGEFGLNCGVASEIDAPNKIKMAEASTFFNEENVKVIRNIFKKEFEKQEKNIGNLISANFKITMEEIKKSQKEIKNLDKEICDLRSSLEFTEKVLEEKVKKLEERCENMETEHQEF